MVDALRFHVCNTPYDFSSATEPPLFAEFSGYRWNGGFNWPPGIERTLRLSLPPNHPATGDPVISGTVQVGEELTALTDAIMDEDVLDDVFTYQWVRVDADGTSNEEDITDATDATYTLTDDDRGKKVKVEVRFVDILGGEETRTSAPTATLPGVTVSKTALTVTEEDTAGDSYTVVLDSQPTANVTVTVAGHAGTDVTPSPTQPDLHADELGHGPDGDGDGRRRCGHGERCGLADPQRGEYGQRLPGHHDRRRGGDGDRQRCAAGRHGVDAGADGDRGGHGRGQLHGGPRQPAHGDCHRDGRRARGHGRDPDAVLGHPDLHEHDLGHGPDGDGDGRRRCGHGERCGLADPQRGEYGQRVPGHHDRRRGGDGDRQRCGRPRRLRRPLPERPQRDLDRCDDRGRRSDLRWRVRVRARALRHSGRPDLHRRCERLHDPAGVVDGEHADLCHDQFRSHGRGAGRAAAACLRGGS